jgi:hypothetical protein
MSQLSWKPFVPQPSLKPSPHRSKYRKQQTRCLEFIRRVSSPTSQSSWKPLCRSLLSSPSSIARSAKANEQDTLSSSGSHHQRRSHRGSLSCHNLLSSPSSKDRRAGANEQDTLSSSGSHQLRRHRVEAFRATPPFSRAHQVLAVPEPTNKTP